jgi:DNA-binding IclR family transcriptional regulator
MRTRAPKSFSENHKLAGETLTSSKSLRSAENAGNGIQALETGAEILRCFARTPQPWTLTAVATATGMPPGKVHRYLRGFMGAGLIVQDPLTRRYDLGPLSYSIGIAALQRHDVVREASSRLGELCETSGESVSLLVWGDGGPVVIRSEESRQYVAVILRVGGTVRLTTSSAGYLFAAFLPAMQTKAMISAELERSPLVDGRRVSARGFAATVADVRQRGLARIRNGPAPDTVAVSAPLFEADGRIVAVITVAGRTQSLVNEPGGRVERELLGFISRLSQSVRIP